RPGRDRARHPEAADQGPLRDQGRGAAAMAKTRYHDLDDAALDDQLAEAKDELFKLRFQLATGQVTNHAPIRQVKRDNATIKDELFKLRFQLATGQLTNHARIRQVKRDIARIKTELRAREIAAAEQLTEENA